MCAETIWQLEQLITTNEIFVRHGVDDITYPIRKDQFCPRLSTVCWEDRTATKSGRK